MFRYIPADLPARDTSADALIPSTPQYVLALTGAVDTDNVAHVRNLTSRVDYSATDVSAHLHKAITMTRVDMAAILAEKLARTHTQNALSVHIIDEAIDQAVDTPAILGNLAVHFRADICAREPFRKISNKGAFVILAEIIGANHAQTTAGLITGKYLVHAINMHGDDVYPLVDKMCTMVAQDPKHTTYNALDVVGSILAAIAFGVTDGLMEKLVLLLIAHTTHPNLLQLGELRAKTGNAYVWKHTRMRDIEDQLRHFPDIAHATNTALRVQDIELACMFFKLDALVSEDHTQYTWSRDNLRLLYEKNYGTDVRACAFSGGNALWMRNVRIAQEIIPHLADRGGNGNKNFIDDILAYSGWDMLKGILQCATLNEGRSATPDPRIMQILWDNTNGHIVKIILVLAEKFMMKDTAAIETTATNLEILNTNNYVGADEKGFLVFAATQLKWIVRHNTHPTDIASRMDAIMRNREARATAGATTVLRTHASALRV